MVYKNPTVRSEAIEDLDGVTARVEVEYDTDNDTTVIAVRTERCETEPSAYVFDRLKEHAMEDIRATIDGEEPVYKPQGPQQ